jgi:hypothetical protein
LFIKFELISILDQYLIDHVKPLDEDRRAFLLGIIKPFEGCSLLELMAKSYPLVADQSLEALEGTEKWIQK